jgi:magnesium transporter
VSKTSWTGKIAAPVDLDQEQLPICSKVRPGVLPVVNHDGVLLGRITIDDVVDVLEEEATKISTRLRGAARQC